MERFNRTLKSDFASGSRGITISLRRHVGQVRLWLRHGVVEHWDRSIIGERQMCAEYMGQDEKTGSQYRKVRSPTIYSVGQTVRIHQDNIQFA